MNTLIIMIVTFGIRSSGVSDQNFFLFIPLLHVYLQRETWNNLRVLFCGRPAPSPKTTTTKQQQQHKTQQKTPSYREALRAFVRICAEEE